MPPRRAVPSRRAGLRRRRARRGRSAPPASAHRPLRSLGPHQVRLVRGRAAPSRDRSAQLKYCRQLVHLVDQARALVRRSVSSRKRAYPESAERAPAGPSPVRPVHGALPHLAGRPPARALGHLRANGLRPARRGSAPTSTGAGARTAAAARLSCSTRRARYATSASCGSSHTTLCTIPRRSIRSSAIS